VSENAGLCPARYGRSNKASNADWFSLLEETFNMFGIGPSEFLICAVIGLLLFGNRLPSAMRSLGQGMTEFKKGLHGVGDEPKAETDGEGR